jgi:hypothetical protein
MAREIDLTKPLSDADRQYLVDRCMGHKLAQNEQYMADGEVQSTGTANEAKNLVTPPQVPVPQPTLVGEQAIVQQANADDGEEVVEEDLPYEEWTFDDLKAEAKARHLSAGGSAKDIIARLEMNDKEEAAKAANS